MEKFRSLRSDEVECRVATVSEKGCSLLLYKDARCDMNILDETVGCMNWQRSHSRENANCTVSIWDAEKAQWISKEDTGTESYTEKEKGLASDSFKRACFNWGIGRELYTAPFIWIKAGDVKLVDGKNGKKSTFDRFTVTDMKVTNGAITALEIKNVSIGKVVFTFGEKKYYCIECEDEIKEAQKKDGTKVSAYGMYTNFGGYCMRCYRNMHEGNKE